MKFIRIKIIARILFVILFLRESLTMYSQSHYETGYPFIHNYVSKDYNADNQNWAIVQDYKGIMYFGNNDGVLEYDGVNWRLIEIPGKSAVRSLAVGQDGRIYVGGTREFGYLEPGNSGNLHYVSLSDRLEEKRFDAVWRVFISSKGIYFFAGRRLIYRYSNDYLFEITVNSQLSEFRGFQIGEDIYAIDVEDGFTKIVRDSLRTLNVGSDLGKLAIYLMLPYDENKILIGTRNDGLFLYDPKIKEKAEIYFRKKINQYSDTVISRFKTNVDEYLKESHIYNGIVLPDGNYAINTLKGGIIIINQDGELVKIFNKDNGLTTNTIYYLFCDINNDLWIAGENGISMIELSTPITKFDRKHGLDGTLLTSEIYEDNIIIGTSSGIYYLPDYTKVAKNIEQNILPVTKDYIFNLNNCVFKSKDQQHTALISSTLRDLLHIVDFNTVENIQTLYAC